MDDPRTPQLNGRVALVTGSSRGLGKAMALELARRGASVAMNYCHGRESAERSFAELAAVTKKCRLVQGDVTDAGDVERLCGDVSQQLGPIDVLIVNATCEQPLRPIEDYSWEFFQRMHDFFVKSPVLLTKACLPHMKLQRWGRIIHITSEVFAMGWPNFSAYAAAKGGQTGLARSNAREFAPGEYDCSGLDSRRTARRRLSGGQGRVPGRDSAGPLGNARRRRRRGRLPGQ
jgi:3-oxoacyl-[acyl-carrier protein] reductase